MVFNTCGKVVDFLSFLHSFSYQDRCFRRHAPPVGLWNGKNGRRWKSLKKTPVRSTFFAFSTTVFHPQQPHQKAKTAKSPEKEKFGVLGCLSCVFCATFSAFFPHRKKRQKNVKHATYPTFEPFHSFRRLY
ncbi:MAG: hypothetical protein IJD75_07720 [Clostridia bacterium]|nr:hypothetical protein [Clostridia bacterium]